MNKNNTGIDNTGNSNTGDWNTGNSNTGYRNTGNWNTGNWNTGNSNTGYWNTGNWNTGNSNTGFFNTDEPTVRMFNKESNLKRDDISFPDYMYFDLTEWVYEDDMTDEEKEEHKEEYKVTGGYLKVHDYKEAFKKAYANASQEEKNATLNLPNFDAELFLEITGIDVRKSKETIKIGDVEFDKEEVEKRLQGLKPIK